MTARFGFVEADRHLVAMVVTTNSTTGMFVCGSRILAFKVVSKIVPILDYSHQAAANNDAERFYLGRAVLPGNLEF